MNYKETEKKLNEIRNKDEILFRMSISHYIDVGIRHLTEELIEETCAEIMEEDDSSCFMTNDYRCKIVRLAGEFAKMDHIYVLTYIGRNIYYDVSDGAPSYGELKDNLERVIDNMWDELTSEDTYENCRYAGVRDNTLRFLGFEGLIECGKTEEEEEK